MMLGKLWIYPMLLRLSDSKLSWWGGWNDEAVKLEDCPDEDGRVLRFDSISLHNEEKERQETRKSTVTTATSPIIIIIILVVVLFIFSKPSPSYALTMIMSIREFHTFTIQTNLPPSIWCFFEKRLSIMDETRRQPKQKQSRNVIVFWWIVHAMCPGFRGFVL